MGTTGLGAESLATAMALESSSSVTISSHRRPAIFGATGARQHQELDELLPWIIEPDRRRRRRGALRRWSASSPRSAAFPGRERPTRRVLAQKFDIAAGRPFVGRFEAGGGVCARLTGRPWFGYRGRRA